MRLLKHKLLSAILLALLFAAPAIAPAYAGKVCGSGPDKVTTSIDLGCKGGGCGQASCNPIYDMAYSVIRFMANGVGLVVVGSLIFAGIQYSASRGDPKEAEAAQNRIQSSVIALLIYIFSWALLNYLLPGGVLHP